MRYGQGIKVALTKIPIMKDTTAETDDKFYDDLLNNKDVRQISGWIESNNSEPTDEAELVKNALRNIGAYMRKVEPAVMYNDNNK